jgi:hypothetical protein
MNLVVFEQVLTSILGNLFFIICFWDAFLPRLNQNFTQMRFSFKFLFYYCATAPVGQGLIIDNSPSHTDAPHSVGLLWTSDQPDEETST